ncbi:MAG: transporter [Erysipelotrichaceae bacterium]|nr:MAG: hypothetical protein FD179_487 [Erysipelotrichaceae bacterium]TXT16942.1 MAG: transporter [Erysipelotrichaceae bacterium]
MEKLWILGPLVFLAGFIDSIAGGGGLISLPAYIFAGIPIHLAMGTNKLSSSIGTFTASITFFIHKKIWIKLALVSALFALIGSWIGASMALWVSETALKTVLILVLPGMALFVLRPRKEVVITPKDKFPWVQITLITFLVGMYDGFIGPGTGSMLIFGFVSVIGMSYTQASANAKVVNLASGIAALITFGFSAQVDVLLGLSAALFSITGNVAGSLMAVKYGKKLIQPLLLVVFGILMIKMIMDVI